jgi:hypothetical protein
LIHRVRQLLSAVPTPASTDEIAAARSIDALWSCPSDLVKLDLGGCELTVATEACATA